MNTFLKLGRIFHNKSLNDLSAETGVSIFRIKGIEDGDTPTDLELEAIGKALGLTPNDVIHLKILPSSWFSVLNKVLGWIAKEPNVPEIKRGN